MANTGFILDKRMKAHDTGSLHPERPARLDAIASAFEQASLDPGRIEFAPAGEEDLCRVHTEAHVERIRRLSAEARSADADTPTVQASWECALLAAGAAIAAAKAVQEGRFTNAFCAIRPPGHHAEPGRAMGFCLFNNIAIAARWLRVKGGVDRVAILDWDVHHGNGTQNAFYEDPSVFYASLHQHPLYPGTGFPNERGAENTNLNVQMPWNAGHDEWIAALDDKVLPAIAEFDPQFLLISCGFDAHRLDPLASQELEAETFALMTHRVRDLAGGKVVSVLEGGYHLDALGESAVAHFKALAEA